MKMKMEINALCLFSKDSEHVSEKMGPKFIDLPQVSNSSKKQGAPSVINLILVGSNYLRCARL